MPVSGEARKKTRTFASSRMMVARWEGSMPEGDRFTAHGEVGIIFMGTEVG